MFSSEGAENGAGDGGVEVGALVEGFDDLTADGFADGSWSTDDGIGDGFFSDGADKGAVDGFADGEPTSDDGFSDGDEAIDGALVNGA